MHLAGRIRHTVMGQLHRGPRDVDTEVASAWCSHIHQQMYRGVEASGNGLAAASDRYSDLAFDFCESRGG